MTSLFVILTFSRIAGSLSSMKTLYNNEIVINAMAALAVLFIFIGTMAGMTHGDGE